MTAERPLTVRELLVALADYDYRADAPVLVRGGLEVVALEDRGDSVALISPGPGSERIGRGRSRARGSAEKGVRVACPWCSKVLTVAREQGR